MMITAKKKKTYGDYQQLPEGAPYQLIGGELIMTPAPTPYHQRVAQMLNRELLKLQEEKIGEVLFSPIDVYLSETETYQPDLIFIASERLNIIGESKIEGAPDLVVEILSPGTAYYDLKHKMKLYEQQGVREYWIVDPMEQSIEVYDNTEGSFKLIAQAAQSGLVQSGIFSSLRVELERIFKTS